MSQLGNPSLLVGLQARSDGSFASQRGGKEGETITANLKGTYAEACLRGQLFSACAGAAGVAPGTAIGNTGALILYNPPTSKVRLEVCFASVGYISGTLGAGTLFHCGNSSQLGTAITGGTGLTIRNMDQGNSTPSQAIANAGGTLAAGSFILYPFVTFGAALASSVQFEAPALEEVGGKILVEPGAAYSMQAVAAAGTSPLLSPAVIWRESPIV